MAKCQKCGFEEWWHKEKDHPCKEFVPKEKDILYNYKEEKKDVNNK